ncbi:metallophosphoesterase family protein [Mesorhizobium sp. BAC0120]|uniref:metallophosphoesterase n=1 Tax=Mesorhizobium sp. BAC0120 TaxID=3090670 RepID=UPI00298BFA52|nr:metallophosphoesterase [Mesorhizobium sp. BAC0120]MDW6021491.1 metallophosphoesterase family protein [Mesorhizobium sp. BAC0120]
MLCFTSDTHFGDPRVLALDRRPFASVREHDEQLIGFWNEIVAPGDEIWHLGDFARAGPQSGIEELLARLNGRKNLIIGNNDDAATVAAAGWSSTQHYAELSVDGKLLILCHYPFLTWNQMGKKSIDLHGHSHGRLKGNSRQYDVGVDVWNFRPVTLEQLLARAAERTRT